jgi:hypothetical protein
MLRLTRLLCILLLSFTASSVVAQEILGPYLQVAQPTSIWIHWESGTHEDAQLLWGDDEGLNHTALAQSVSSENGRWHHRVHLENLDARTRYSYQLISDEYMSETFHFKTPAPPSEEAPFRLLAMSDMQQDHRRPDQFRTLIEEGVIEFITEVYGPDLAEELGMILVPGDLVENGSIYAQWAVQFFDPAARLFPYVPVYPVPGNHERNSPYYFQYFQLPDNGSEGFEEHWYSIDQGNVRVIGLDSNGLYRNMIQLSWLESTLDRTCDDEHIDFVFAQLHHPHHSELWPDGNTYFTGEVIERLEQFTTACDKPSVHFFGHTHGYSRGQSRDHRHLMVNVASAGGNIDYWDEYTQIDYEEYSVSQDEYGFVIVEVEAGEDPHFQLQRVSLGNEDLARDLEIRDEVTIHRYNTPPETPEPVGLLGTQVNPRCFTLALTPYADDDGEAQSATHWQISTTCDDFETPLIDRWRQRENWYRDVDLQMSDQLSDEVIEGLEEETEYCWRGRYRDSGLEWSEWSTPQPFTTSRDEAEDALLINPGAEDGLEGWVVEEGVFESLVEYECNGTTPFEGLRYFVVGGLCESSAYAVVHQQVDLSEWDDDIQTGEVTVAVEAYAKNWNGSDRPALGLHFIDERGEVLSDGVQVETSQDEWTLLRLEELAPPSAAKAVITLYGMRRVGGDNDSYFDSVKAQIIMNAAQCDAPPSPSDPSMGGVMVDPSAGAESSGGDPTHAGVESAGGDSTHAGDPEGGARSDLVEESAGEGDEESEEGGRDMDITLAGTGSNEGSSTEMRSADGGCATGGRAPPGFHSVLLGGILVMGVGIRRRRRSMGWTSTSKVIDPT